MSTPLSQEEKMQVVEDYLNNKGLWWDFKDFVEDKGYTLKEIGFEEED